MILAAGEKVYLQASKDQSLRGLLVEVDAGGKAWNQLTGQISTPHGNVTMVGLAVNQQGRISATTSIGANGSVRLLARDSVIPSDELGFVATRGGVLEIGSTSAISVLPDLADTATAVDDQTQLKSSVQLGGREIFLRGGSSIVAPSGTLDVQAQVDPSQPARSPQSDQQSRIRMEAGAVIDMSGSDATASVTRNFVSVELRANELRDSPQQRDGALRGQTVVVDARVATPFADVAGALAAMQRTVAERTGAGGTVNFSSDGDIAVESGARIDVSGGQLDYLGGEARTSSLIASDGQVFDIGVADPSRTYVGIVQPVTRVVHDRWGVVETVASPSFSRYEPGYASGFSAGTVQFASPAMQLNGTLVGETVTGPFQRTPSTAAAGGRLIIGMPGGGGLVPYDYRAPDINFTRQVSPVVVSDATALPANLALQLPLDFLTSGGFTRTELYSNGTITLPEDTPLQLAAGSSLSMRANRMDLLSGISNPGGTLNFTADATASIAGATRARAGVQVGDGVTFDLRGTWTNDSLLPASAQPTDRVYRDGGSVSLRLDRSLEVASSAAELVVGADAQFLVGGGGWVRSNGALTGGKGGQVSLLADASGSSLQLDPGITLQGFGVAGAAGGSLAMAASRVEIAPSASSWYNPGRIDFTGTSFLTLAPGLFDNYGFSNFDFTANGPTSVANAAIAIAATRAGALVNIQPRTIVLAAGDLTRPTGGQVTGFGTTQLLDENLRPASSFSLSAQPRNVVGDRIGGLAIENGSVLQAGARSSFTLSSTAGIRIDGTVSAPSGSIRLAELSPDASTDRGYDPGAGIELGSTAVLNAAGTTLLQNTAQPFRVGNVLGGGTVELLADRGSIVAHEGSLIDVSGTQSRLDFAATSPQTPYQRTLVASAGGQVTLRAAESIQVDGSMRAMAGVGDTGAANAGTLSVEMSRTLTPTQGTQTPFPIGPRVVSLVADDVPGQVPPNGVALLRDSRIEAAGFGSLSVKAQDRIDIGAGFSLDLARSLQLDSPQIAMQAGSADLAASYVRIGSTLPRDVAAPSTAGTGRLDISGDFIEVVGSSALQGIASTTLDSAGDLRLRGTERSGGASIGALLTAGDLEIRASRVYPATGTQFLLQSSGTAGSTIRFSQAGASPGTPLSVADRCRCAPTTSSRTAP